MKNKKLLSNKKIIILSISVLVMIIIITLATCTAKKDKLNTVPEAIIIQTTAETTTKTAKSQWNLILVNKNNPIPKDYSINLKQLANGHKIDERCYEDLQKMMEDCRSEGLEPVICSSYRTNEKQTELYNRQIEKWKAIGYSDADAKIEAGKLVAVPGTSEHQLGLALDIVDISYQLLDENQENTAVQKWLMQNSWKYGFILRYPTDKRDITGISYEPWHYRYVGQAAAKEIYDSGVCLEEYLMQ